MSDDTEPVLMESALHLLHRAGQTADVLFASEIDEALLTPRQFAVLVALAGNDSASQTELVQLTGIDRSTLAEIVKRLVSRGLLARRRSRLDARAYSVRLTAEGTALMKLTAPKVARIEDRLLKAIPAARRAALAADLATIVRGTAPAQPLAANDPSDGKLTLKSA